MSPPDFYLQLAELLRTIEEMTGLEVCVYPSEGVRGAGGSAYRDRLPHSFSSHFGEFCRIVKANRTGRGCGGHDSHLVVQKSAEIGKPFVSICHAGLAEVVFPVYGHDHTHVATVFIGQVLTDDIAALGFAEIARRTRDLGLNHRELLAAYRKLPRMSAEKLLRLGVMASMAIRGLGEALDFKDVERQLLLGQYPMIRNALRMIDERSGHVTEQQVAQRLNVHQSYFSRLFKRVVGRNFKDYIMTRRIQRAKLMLHHSRLPIAEIAARCHFSRQSYFARQFKAITAMTPSQYRRQGPHSSRTG